MPDEPQLEAAKPQIARNVRGGSIATDLGCPRDVRFPPNVVDHGREAEEGHMKKAGSKLYEARTLLD
jgi:hypothetical protein